MLSYRLIKSDIPYVAQGLAIATLFGRLFYDSHLAVFCLLPVAFIYVYVQKKNAKQRRTRQAGVEFKDAIFSVLTSLRAGYSVENSFKEASKDMALLYGKQSDIYRLVAEVNKGLKNGIPLEKLIYRMGKETENSDILDFAMVFSVAKRNGGNMTETIEKTINVLIRKLEVEKEIDVLISARRLESRIMNCVPFFIIIYISITSPGFFQVLYHNIFGIILMTICMITYIGSYLLSEKIVNISI